MRTTVELERVRVREHDAVQVQVVPLILSATDINNSTGRVKLTAGYRGLSNVRGELSVGDYLEFDIPQHGLFELRLMKVYYFPKYPYSAADIAISCLFLAENAAEVEAILPDVDPMKSGADAPFSASEKAHLRAAIHEFREQIRAQYKPSPEQDAAITDELRNLSEMLDALRRRVDWKGIVISTLVNIGTTLALTPGGLRQLTSTLVNLLRAPLGLP